MKREEFENIICRTKLCSMGKIKKENPDWYEELVKPAKFICQQCKKTARKSSLLCYPEKIK